MFWTHTILEARDLWLLMNQNFLIAEVRLLLTFVRNRFAPFLFNFYQILHSFESQVIWLNFGFIECAVQIWT